MLKTPPWVLLRNVETKENDGNAETSDLPSNQENTQRKMPAHRQREQGVRRRSHAQQKMQASGACDLILVEYRRVPKQFMGQIAEGDGRQYPSLRGPGFY